jgi:hypothetical protein
LLEAEAAKDPSNADPEHYLQGFTDKELVEVVAQYERWSPNDQVLARKILAERGKPISEELITVLREQRNEDLAGTEPPQTPFIVVGYVFAVLGGFLGIAIGWYMNMAKKTLPNGDKVYVYGERDRWHGKLIYFIGLVVLIAWIVLRIYRAMV